jgi:hypothetical protein
MRTWQKWTLGVVAALIVIWAITALTFWSVAPKPKQDGPQVVAAKALVATADDGREAGTIIDTGYSKPVPCGIAARNAFDPHTGAKKYFYFQWEGGAYECFDTPGYHRVRGVKLEPLGSDQVSNILKDTAKYPSEAPFWDPPAKFTSQPRPVHRQPAPAATPLPELGEGPCCSK